MFKRIISLALIVCMIFTSNVFAFKWEMQNGEWVAVDDNVPVCLSYQLLNDNGFVYFTDEIGRPITGWYVSPENHNVYFFDTKIGETAGRMVFGLKSINNRLYYFNDDGSMARSKAEGEYIKAFTNGADEYWASYTGELYLNNQLMVVQNPDYTCGYSWFEAKDFIDNSEEILAPVAQ